MATKDNAMDENTIEESAKTVRQYLDPILLKPLSELGLLVKDKIAFWRFSNQVKMLQKTKSILDAAGIDPASVRGSITPDLVIPLIEASGDSSDDEIGDMFASLLASSIDPRTHDSSHPSFSKVLAQLSPIDARVLKALFASVKKHESELVAGKEIQNLQKGIPLHRQLTIPLENASKHFGLNDNIIQISFQNLRRLGICDQGHDALNFVNREEMIAFTDYGYSLCSLCVK